MMSILRGPGILLNSITTKQPVYLPQLFDRTLAAPGANLCGVKDELGAIAHALHEGGKPDAGNRLFGILESADPLADRRDDILECVAHAKLPFLRQAMRSSHRFFKEGEEICPKHGIPRRASDVEIAAALCKHATRAAAAEALDYSPASISRRITQVAEDSLLGIFKGAFTRHRSTLDRTPPTVPDETNLTAARRRGGSEKKTSDAEIAAALKKHPTQTAAAKALGIAQSTISTRLGRATDDSDLANCKDNFSSRATDGVSHADVAAALKEHSTLTVAAKALGISRSTIARWIKGATEDSPLHEFIETFKLGRPKTNAATENREAEIRRKKFLRRISPFRHRRK